MNSADSIFDDLDGIYAKWGLRENPFSESALDATGMLHAPVNVFTGRTNELRDIFSMLRSASRRRILIYGWMGIGKTALVLEALDTLRRKRSSYLVNYVSLPANARSLADSALIALAQAMVERNGDSAAMQILAQLGIPALRNTADKERKFGFNVGVVSFEQASKSALLATPTEAAIAFDGLLDRTLGDYGQVVIAIDDLDKQKPAQVRQLLREAQGMLKGRASFILTGHPGGLTRDIVTRDLGLFDLMLRLDPLNPETTYAMLVNYLNSVREEPVEDASSPEAVRPFTPEAANLLCERSTGVPRYLNRLASYSLLKAAELNAKDINEETLLIGLAHADEQIRGQRDLTDEARMVFKLLTEKGILSDDNLTLAELGQVGLQEFNEILPILEDLVQRDLARRLPSERAMEYSPSPLVIPPTTQDTGD